MKSLSKFLTLLVVIAVILLVGWKLLDSSLFETIEDPPAIEASQSLPASPSPPVEPPTLSSDDVYSSTTADESIAPSPNLTCDAADAIVGKLYDMRVEGKSKDAVTDFISNDDSIPDEQVESFLGFAKILWKTPKDQLVNRTHFVEQFMKQCRRIEQESKPAH